MQAKKAILVTGGAGYIGSHVCKLLYQKGYAPIVIDNLNVGHPYAVQWGPLVYGDIHNKKLIETTLKTYRPIAVMHFAADALVGESLSNPSKYYHNNLSGTISLLRAMQETGINNLIFSSTCATYGHPVKIPMDENHPQNPINPYGRSKWMVEQILQDFSKAHGLHYFSLRYFNAAGADLDLDIGEDRVYETHLIPLVMQAAYHNTPIQIFGNDFDTKDKTAVRDYIHVMDLAEAHVKAMEWLLKHRRCLCVNLGTGTGFSVKEIIQAAEKICQKSVLIKQMNRRQGDPAILVANAKQASKILDWKPTNSQIDIIITSAWKWYQKKEQGSFNRESINTKAK